MQKKFQHGVESLIDLPLVSIVMPAFNQKKYIAETLDSVVNQVYPNWECIIVDDGSTDGTDKITEDFAEKDPRFKFISQKNQGPSVARNRGISEGKGEYILPLDSDDLISPSYIKEAMDVFARNPKTKLVYCDAEFFGEQTGKWNLPEYSYGDIFFSNMIFCSAVFRRCDFGKTGGYNTNMRDGLEDWDFWLSLLNKNDIVFRIPKIHFSYRIKNSSRNADLNRSLEVVLETHRQIFLNHKKKYREIFQKKFLKNFPDDMLKNINSREGGLENLTKFRKIGFAEQMSENIRSVGERIIAKFSFVFFSPQNFFKKYFSKFLNCPLRQPVRKVWYVLMGKKFS